MKPANTSLKDHLMKEVAEQMELPLELVKSIIDFQGEDAAKAAHTYNEIEFSGLGKLLLSQHRLKKRIFFTEKKLEEGRVKEEDLERYIKHLEDLKRRQK